MTWSGFLGAGTPTKAMGTGRAQSPCEGQTQICLHGHGKAQRRIMTIGLGDRTGERKHGTCWSVPLLKWCGRYYHTHLAVRSKLACITNSRWQEWVMNPRSNSKSGLFFEHISVSSLDIGQKKNCRMILLLTP